MAKFHRVRQGECLSSIAERYGFGSWETLWDANSDLQETRPNPHLLMPGDKVEIPPHEEFEVDTGAWHKFKAIREQTMVRLRLRRSYQGEGVKAKGELYVEKSTEPIACDISDGVLEAEVPADARQAVLLVLDQESEAPIDIVNLRLGALDPIQTASGMRMRLARLGYPCGGARKPNDVDNELLFCIKAFQDSHEVDDTDEPYGQATQDKLKEVLEEEFDS